MFLLLFFFILSFSDLFLLFFNGSLSDAEAEDSDPDDSDADKAPSPKRVSAIQVAPSPVSSFRFFPVKEVPAKKGAKDATAEGKKQKEQEEVEQQENHTDCCKKHKMCKVNG